MRRIVCVLVALLVFTACSDDVTTPSEILNIALTASKSEALADGKDKIEFSVTTSQGEDVTELSEIRVNDKVIAEKEFSSSKPLLCKVVASYKGAKSDTIEVRFIEYVIPKRLEIKLSKQKLTADGYDRVQLSCIDAENKTDVTKNVEFYADNNKLEGSVFTTSKEGTYEISAKYGTATVPSVEVEAVSAFTPTPKLYVELFSAVWCPYCPNGVFLLDELQDNKNVIAVNHHPSDRKFDPFYERDCEKLFHFLELKYVPRIVLDRDKSRVVKPKSVSQVTEQIPTKTKVGIAIASSVPEKEAEIKAYFRTKETIPNANYVVLIVENNLPYDQRNIVKGDYPDPIKDYIHNNVFRSFSGDKLGESLVLSADKVTEKSLTMQLDEKWNLENCEVIVFVTDENNVVMNVQKVKLGKEIGY